jgi:hypothetical protein
MGSYCIVRNLNIPLIVQPHIFSFLSVASWVQVSGNIILGRFLAHADAVPTLQQQEIAPLVLARIRIDVLRLGCSRGLDRILDTGARSNDIFRHALLTLLTQPLYGQGKQGAEIGVDFLGVISIIVMAIGLLCVTHLPCSQLYVDLYLVYEISGRSTTKSTNCRPLWGFLSPLYSSTWQEVSLCCCSPAPSQIQRYAQEYSTIFLWHPRGSSMFLRLSTTASLS